MDIKQAKQIVEVELKKALPRVTILAPNGRTAVPYLSVSRRGRVSRVPLPPNQYSLSRTGKLY